MISIFSNKHIILEDSSIGSGSFGISYKGVISKEYCSEMINRNIFEVVVKIPHYGLSLKKANVAPSIEYQNGKKLKFDQVIKPMMNLKHEHIVLYYGLYSNENINGYVMEYCEYGNLNFFISLLNYEAEGFQSLYPTLLYLSYMLEIANAFVYLHSQSPSIIHTNLCFENILITKTLSSKLADFGLAKLNRIESIHVNEQGHIERIPPECINNITRESDVYTDYYQYGITLYEVLIGVCSLRNPDYGHHKMCMYEKAKDGRLKTFIDEYLNRYFDAENKNLQKILPFKKELIQLICSLVDAAYLNRPKFDEICDCLSFLQDNSMLIDIENLKESSRRHIELLNITTSSSSDQVTQYCNECESDVRTVPNLFQQIKVNVAGNVNIQIGQVINFYNNSSNNESPSKPFAPVQPTSSDVIDNTRLFNLQYPQEILRKTHLNMISNESCCQEKWGLILYRLGMKQTEIEQITKEIRDDQERLREGLRRWWQARGENATAFSLSVALKEEHCFDALLTLARHFNL